MKLTTRRISPITEPHRRAPIPIASRHIIAATVALVPAGSLAGYVSLARLDAPQAPGGPLCFEVRQ